MRQALGDARRNAEELRLYDRVLGANLLADALDRHHQTLTLGDVELGEPGRCGLLAGARQCQRGHTRIADLSQRAVRTLRVARPLLVGELGIGDESTPIPAPANAFAKSPGL